MPPSGGFLFFCERKTDTIIQNLSNRIAITICFVIFSLVFERIISKIDFTRLSNSFRTSCVGKYVG